VDEARQEVKDVWQRAHEFNEAQTESAAPEVLTIWCQLSVSCPSRGLGQFSDSFKLCHQGTWRGGDHEVLNSLRVLNLRTTSISRTYVFPSERACVVALCAEPSEKLLDALNSHRYGVQESQNHQAPAPAAGRGEKDSTRHDFGARLERAGCATE